MFRKEEAKSVFLFCTFFLELADFSHGYGSYFLLKYSTLKKLDARYCKWYYIQCLDFVVFFLSSGFCCVLLKSVKIVFQNMDLLTDQLDTFKTYFQALFRKVQSSPSSWASLALALRHDFSGVSIDFTWCSSRSPHSCGSGNLHINLGNFLAYCSQIAPFFPGICCFPRFMESHLIYVPTQYLEKI